MEDMTVMVVDGGARGHVLSDAYEKDPRVKRIIVAPGNDFVGWNRNKEVIIAKDCSLKDPKSLLAVAKYYHPDIVDVAQDDALALGTVDLLTENGFPTFGPTRQAAQIEWDKTWSRDFMNRHKIPSPAYSNFDNEADAQGFVEGYYDPRHSNPGALYVKASGLAAGKGALRSANLQEAMQNIKRMKSFKDAGSRFVIEEEIRNADGTPGEEISYMVLSNGVGFWPFKPAQDNKLAENFDRGDQTGGMGSNAPSLAALGAETEMNYIVGQAIKGMRHEGRPYVGILYAGTMKTDNGIKVVEFNSRFGDPEVQTILPGVENYAEMVMVALSGKASNVRLKDDKLYRWCVVGASRGYPNDYSQAKGKRIHGIREARKLQGVKFYGAGIKIDGGNFIADGGRLFSIVAEGRTPLEAKQRAYEAMSYIDIQGNNLHFRTDIGWRDVNRYFKGLQS